MNEGNSTNYRDKFMEFNDRFDAVFELTTAASKIINYEFTILKVNKALADLLRYPAEELLDTKIMEYSCEENIYHWHELQSAMWKDGQQTLNWMPA